MEKWSLASVISISMIESVMNFVVFLVVSMHLLPTCSTDIINDSETIRLNNSLTSNQCGNCPWRMGSDCHCADSLDGVIYCDSLGEPDVFIDIKI